MARRKRRLRLRRRERLFKAPEPRATETGQRKFSLCAPRVERNECVGLVITRDQALRGLDGRFAVGAERAVTAVVQDDVDGAAGLGEAVDFVREACGDFLRGGFAPVSGHGVPEHGGELEFARDAEDNGTAGAVGRAEVANGRAGDLLQCVAGARELFADAVRGGAREIGMGPGVVAEEMALRGDAAHQIRLRRSKAAQQEERGLNAVGSEDVEELWRPGGIGAVIEGERQFTGARGSGECTAKDARGGPTRGVGEASGGKAEAGGDGKARVDCGCKRRKHLELPVCGGWGWRCKQRGQMEHGHTLRRPVADGRILYVFGLHPESAERHWSQT